MAVRFAVLFFLLATPAVVYGAQHLVGGNGAWDTSGDYKTWAAGQTFTPGDTLVFNYDSSHGVDRVSQNDYDNCNAGNALESYTGGKTTISLNQSGPMYFMCPTSGHCQQGMKLAINVQQAASGGANPPSSTTPAAGPTTPSTPSGSTTPATPSTTKNSPNGNGAAGVFGRASHWMVGFSLVLAALFVRV
ncbi:hypothetical protein ACH5RR_000449 [Cinchona calisaya]|uniref:Phytocyanin domain-containing protein n=1 Tax=Cinchona calisaya TaxID=153742 RepID=A0ABD3B0T0_9GENT